MSTEQTGPGHVLSGRYRLTELIGAGGMGRVWRGEDELLDRQVAIKELIISPQLPQQEIDVLRTRMLREARSAARLGHPSIITVFDVVESDDRPWIVMELVRGRSLGDIIKEDGALTPARAAKIGLQMATALSIAHDRGIVHRDIKPGNVLVGSGDRAVLTDFGIARLDGTSGLTSTGLLIGSPGYLAPEQAQGRPATPATDIWSLGVTLYQAVEGRMPFHREVPVATLTAIVTEEVPPPGSAGPLTEALEAMLTKDPEGRPSITEAHALLHAASVAAERSQARADRDAMRAARTTVAEPPPVADPSAAASAAPAGAAGGERPPYLPPGPGAAEPSGSGRAGRTALLIGAACIALLLAVGLAFWLGQGEGADPAETGPAAEQEAGGDTGDGEAAPDGEDGAEEEPEEEEEPEPEGPPVENYADETGFSADLPEGWEYDRREGTSVFFDLPGGGYLQIDQTDSPGDDAEQDWRQQEGAISQNFSGYQRQHIRSLDDPWTDRYVSAADWEFTFDGRHAVNRAFHTEDKGYALFLVSPPETWEENRALLDGVAASFDPAS
ncbi:serine/threonine-protein kinase [Nocardiopsis potens]|uniref:serine/threonine-protein kinase n=1 Tax=Nocardiopsis potens TaxID=1246458 RepID=UPI00047585F6|nr:serine/threonine-protein kinase [Nocardiopsis potens]